LNLYGFVGNDGVNGWDVLGNLEGRPPYFWELGRPILYVGTSFSQPGGQCGQHLVYFQVHLSHPAPEDGFLVQKIERYVETWKCGPGGTKGESLGVEKETMWEAWFIKKGETQTPRQKKSAQNPNPNKVVWTDKSGWKKGAPGCIGEVEVKGTFRFHPASTTGMLGGPDIVPGEVVIPQVPDWNRQQSEHARECCLRIIAFNTQTS